MAVDLGATNVRVAIGDKKGIKKKSSEKTDKNNGPEGIVKQIIRMIKILKPHPEAVGIGSIGPIDINSGKIINTPNLPFKEIALIGPLSEVLGTDVKLLNDCSAGVLGEYFFGAGKGIKNQVYLTFSTGLGCGVIIDGHLLCGKDGNAHEVGHITIDSNSELECGCGCFGHWEAYSSGNGLPKFVKMLSLKNNFKKTYQNSFNVENINSEKLFKMAKENHPFGLKVIEELGKINAQGFGDIVNIYDPELITVGGSIAINNSDLILRPIIQGIDKHLINRKPRIIITPLGEDIILYGALALATEMKMD
ncbi:ROK family protein [Candidatus Bathyarchaeota archaeon]|nr:ROK family protein [Candidatus Bathyarchaeota archaeon]